MPAYPVGECPWCHKKISLDENAISPCKFCNRLVTWNKKELNSSEPGSIVKFESDGDSSKDEK